MLVQALEYYATLQESVNKMSMSIFELCLSKASDLG